MITLLQILSHLFAWMPRSLALAIGRGLGWILGSVVRHRRGEILETLGRCFPELETQEREGIYRRMYRNLGMTGIEQLRIGVRGLEEYRGLMKVSGGEHYADALAQGKGAIGLVAHVGNWELCGYSTLLVDAPISIVVKQMKNKKFSDYLVRTRERMGLRMLFAKTAYRHCLTRLRKGEAVAMIMDQNTRIDRGIFVDFFGRPACTAPGMALIASQTQSPIVPLCVVRKPDNTYELIIQPPIDPPPDRKPETLHQATQLYTKIIEDMIRQYPDQWVWLHRRWRTQPPAAEMTNDEIPKHEGSTNSD